MILVDIKDVKLLLMKKTDIDEETIQSIISELPIAFDTEKIIKNEVIEKKEKSIQFEEDIFIFSVMKEFGISNRRAGLREMGFIQKWKNAYNFELVIEACNRTLKSVRQPSFEYADCILSKWTANNVTQPSELKSFDETIIRNRTKR